MRHEREVVDPYAYPPRGLGLVAAARYLAVITVAYKPEAAVMDSLL